MQLRKILDSDLTGKGVVGQSDTPGLSALEMQQKVEEIARAVIIPIFNENVDTLEQNAGTTDGTLAQKADKTYVDAQDDAIRTAMAGQKTELQQAIASGDSQTLADAKAYTDARETAVKQYVDAQDAATLRGAKTYAQTQDAATLQSAKTYADETGAAGKTYADQKSAQALDNAKSYADEQDGVTLASAKTYTDTQLGGKADADDVYTKSQADALLVSKADKANVLTKDNSTPFTPTEDYQPATKAYADSIAAEAGAVTSVFGRAGAVVAQAGDYTAGMVGARPDTWLPTAADIGLGNVDNTSDMDKPISTACQTALNQKAGKSVAVSTTLLAASWTGEEAPYSYTLAVSGVTLTSNQEILPPVDVTQEQLDAMQLANIQDGGQQAGEIILKAWGVKPTVDLPIRVIVRGDG